MTQSLQPRGINGLQAARQQSAATFTPRADILETPEEMLVLLDMPGVKAEGVEVHFERGELVVQGHVEPPPERDVAWLAAEYEVGAYHRAFLIGQEIDASRISAELKAGVLTLHLPKAESV